MKKDFMAYYFPNWHPDPRNSAWHGEGWTEWEVTKHATPRFEGHKQPKVPLWGYEDESVVENMEKKIDAAKNHSVSGFIFDWYWFNDGSYRIKCVDEAFLGSKNRDGFKFAIMWANHDPIYVHPASYLGIKNKSQVLLDGHLSEEAFIEATNHCIEKYFSDPNYYEVDGGLYYGFYRTDMLIESFGGVKHTREMLDDFRERAKKAGFPKLNIVANAIYAIPGWNTDKKAALALIKEAGFDSVAEYGIGSNDGESAFPHATYDKLCTLYVDKTKETIALVKEAGLNCYITTASGWDASPRTVQSDKYDNIGYPFSSICNDSTPEKFEKLLTDVKALADNNDIPLVTCFAWNEWTEGGYLEPDTEYKYGYLEAINKVFGK